MSAIERITANDQGIPNPENAQMDKGFPYNRILEIIEKEVSMLEETRRNWDLLSQSAKDADAFQKDLNKAIKRIAKLCPRITPVALMALRLVILSRLLRQVLGNQVENALKLL